MLFAPYTFIMVLVSVDPIPLLVLRRETVEHCMHEDVGRDVCRTGHAAAPGTKPSTGKLCSVKVWR